MVPHYMRRPSTCGRNPDQLVGLLRHHVRRLGAVSHVKLPTSTAVSRPEGNHMIGGLRAMVSRDPAEPHRASTPLELLFDLVFVVAVSRASGACTISGPRAISPRGSSGTRWGSSPSGGPG